MPLATLVGEALRTSSLNSCNHEDLQREAVIYGRQIDVLAIEHNVVNINP